MLPYTPLHHLLLAEAGRPLVMTSGNLSDEPIASATTRRSTRLADIADVFLVHDREIESRCDDSVARVIAGWPTVLRRSRGWVPRSDPVRTCRSPSRFSRVGAHLKNTFCIGLDGAAYLGPHIGDLENARESRGIRRGDRSRIERFLRRSRPRSSPTICTPTTSRRLCPRAGAAGRSRCSITMPTLRARWPSTDSTGPGHRSRLRRHGIRAPTARHGAARSCAWKVRLRAPRHVPSPHLTRRRDGHPGDLATRAGHARGRVPEGPPLERLPLFSAGRPAPRRRGQSDDHPRRVLHRPREAWDAISTPSGRSSWKGRSPATRGRSRRPGTVLPTRASAAHTPSSWISRTAPRSWTCARPFARPSSDYLAGRGPATISARFHNTLARGTGALVRRAVQVARDPSDRPDRRLLPERLLTRRVVENLAGESVYLHRNVPPGDGGLALGQAFVASAIVSKGDV